MGGMKHFTRVTGAVKLCRVSKPRGLRISVDAPEPRGRSRGWAPDSWDARRTRHLQG